MGWCAEFGPQIGAGCEHPMVAGDASCHCVECGVVCSGRFRGCGAVWDRGPVAQPVVRRRATRAPSAGPAEPAATAPGETAAVPVAPTVAPPPSVGPAPAVGAAVPPLAASGDRVSAFLMALDDVRSELRALHQAVERQQEFLAAAERRERALADVADLLDHIPGRVSAAIRGALAEVGTARPVTTGPAPIEAAEWEGSVGPVGPFDELPPVAPPDDFRDSA